MAYRSPSLAASANALGGALALGTVVRLFDPDRSRRSRVILSCAFAVGLLILATSRPYEGFAFSIPLFGYFGYRFVKAGPTAHLLRDGRLPMLLIGIFGIFGMGYYNHATTGDAFVMPYVLNHRTYWPLPFFLGENANPHPESPDPVFAKFFKVTEREYGLEKIKTLPGILSLEIGRFWQDWFFYVGPALTLPVLIGLISCMMQPPLRIAVLGFLSTALALALCVYSMPHYAAVATVAIFVFTVEGLRYLWATQQRGERAFVIAVVITVMAMSVTRQSATTSMNTTFHFPDQRKLIAEQLSGKPGKQLLLVTYDLDRHYPGNELVHNGADFSTEKILWARSKGRENDLDLCRAYPDRKFWRVITDDEYYSLSALSVCP